MNWFEKFISKINVKGVLTLSSLATACWIVMLGCLEWIDKDMDKAGEIVRAVIVHPITFDFLQNWLNLAWAIHIPFFVFNERPRWLTRIFYGALTAHWVLFALVISNAEWYSMSIKFVVWLFSTFVMLSNFKVEMGDDV